MAEDTQQLLKVPVQLAVSYVIGLWEVQNMRLALQDCQLSVYKPNPRQYTAQIPLVSSCPHTAADLSSS